MTDQESEEEFIEDFGARKLDEAAIARILERARASNDVELRRLVKEVQVWRNTIPPLLDRIAPPGSAIDESDALLKFVRFLVRGEGAIR